MLFCFPSGQLFEVHGSKLKSHPFGDLGQASVKCITHTMLFFGIGKDPLNGFLAFGIKIFVFRGVPGVIGQFLVIFPNMAQDGFHAVFGMGAQVPGGTLSTDLRVAAIFPLTVPVSGTVCQGLVFWADHTVIIFIINILPRRSYHRRCGPYRQTAVGASPSQTYHSPGLLRFSPPF